MPYNVTVDCADAAPEAASTANAIKLFFIEKLQKLKNKTRQGFSIFCANIFLPGQGRRRAFLAALMALERPKQVHPVVFAHCFGAQ
jgi:hypothetical protein